MASHNCSEAGCGFYLPEWYLFSKCPWHSAPTSDTRIKLAVVGGALAFLSAGYGLSKLDSWRRSKQEQEEVNKARKKWREWSKSRKQSDQTADTNADEEGDAEEASEQESAQQSALADALTHG